MSEKPPFTLKGWRCFARYEDTADSLAEAILLARWALDDNSWMVCEIIDADGEVIMTRDDIVYRAQALTNEEAYGP
jgi:hypothetical protein